MNPWIAGHVCWPLTERLVRRDTMRRATDLHRTDFASADELRLIQTRKLRRLLALAAQHCPFYARRFRDAGIDAGDPRLDLDVLQRLPLLSRDDVRDHLDEISWLGCPGGRPRRYNTGGSSGEPLQFWLDRVRQSADWAARWRARQWWNVRPGDRELLIWAAPTPKTLGLIDRLREARDRHLLNQVTVNAFDMTDEHMDAALTFLQRWRPACLYGYASSIGLLARRALAAHPKTRVAPASRRWDFRVLGCTRSRYADVTLPDTLRAVFVTGESLSRADRADIEAAFRAPVVIEYGSRDCGFVAGMCPAGRLHAAEENVIVELLDPDGTPVPPGEPGEIVVTCLESFATPLIRYRVGDLASLASEADGDAPARCTCGRTSLALSEIRGRVTDQIIRIDRGKVRRMHALSLMYVLREADGLRQFRITQPAIDRLDVEIVTDARFTAAVERSILDGLRTRMGEGVTIGLHRRQQIPPGRSGKHACVVSLVNTKEIA